MGTPHERARGNSSPSRRNKNSQNQEGSTSDSLLVSFGTNYWRRLVELTVSRIDVSGSLVMDTKPRFPPPGDLIEEIPVSHPTLALQNLISTWNINFPDLIDISQVFLSLANLVAHMNEQVHNPGFWNNEFFLALTAYPVAYELTSLPRYPLLTEQSHEADGIVMREILRITFILFFGLLKERFEIEPNGIRPNCGKISKLLRFHSVDWSRFLELRLWVLTISALAERGEERQWFLAEISYTMVSLGLSTWDQALDSLRNLVWSDDMVANGVDILRQEIDQI
jgi:hypothetical protein